MIIKQLLTYLRIFIAILITGYFAIKVTLQSYTKNSKQKYRRNAHRWGYFILKTFNVKLKINGLEHLNPESTYILTANHTSLFDIPIMFYSFKDFNFIIVYKKELEKIPIFGRSLKVSPFVSVNRADPRNAMKSIEQTLNQMQENDCPIIFPEGTRSKDGKLSDFKRGAFLIASKSSKPIVPISIQGSSEILPKGSLNVKTNSTVTVTINPPIENTGETDRKSEKNLMKKVHDIIASNLD